MSDAIKHECGIALLKLKKPLHYYHEKYKTPLYGLNKMYLLMEKQHNRGQDGAGVANIKFDMPPGTKYINRRRSNGGKPIQEVFEAINAQFSLLKERSPEKLKDTEWLKHNASFTGELFLGHLRYGTFGKNSIESCHPFLRQNNWMTRNLVVAGNFNLTNVDELFSLLVNLGQFPKEKSDTVTVLEKIGHFLDVENEELFGEYKKQGHSNQDISSIIAKNLDIQKILTKSAEDWDGGYVMAGLLGHGDAFVLRDPNGIRPAYWYEDDEVAVVCSERPVIQTTFNVTYDKIKELKPGHALILKKDGNPEEKVVRQPEEKKSCSFERIYFSRGNDISIYNERKQLGHQLTENVIQAINNELNRTVFSFIPNTAETAFYGLVKGIEKHLDKRKKEQLIELGTNPSPKDIERILATKPRVEKIAVKDVKLRTFITDDDSRDDMVAHVYDVTYGAIKRGKDNLVILDDSIVRGTTLKQSIIRMLDRLGPKKIVIVSSAPQIRYPDCYGIDMAKMGDFIAFQAAIALLKDTKQEHIIDDVYQKCKKQVDLPKEQIQNFVKEIYQPFTSDQISKKIGELLKRDDVNTEIEVIYQSIEGLHEACPDHKGDWYFTGDFPTPGGNKVVNKSYINYIEGKNERAY